MLVEKVKPKLFVDEDENPSSTVFLKTEQKVTELIVTFAGKLFFGSVKLAKEPQVISLCAFAPPIEMSKFK